MKKVLFLFVIFVVSFFLFVHFYTKGNTEVYTPKQLSQSENIVSPSASPSIPSTIDIPAINVHANVESVGMDAQGRMGVPNAVMDTAWYKYGFLPGSKGSAVIDGHYDTQTGAPAVFYNISKLKIGDSIITTDTNNKSYTFIVTKVTSYPYNNLPMQEIFASTDKPRLNLITCDGVWNRTTHNYSNRTVVYAEITP